MTTHDWLVFVRDVLVHLLAILIWDTIGVKHRAQQVVIGPPHKSKRIHSPQIALDCRNGSE